MIGWLVCWLVGLLVVCALVCVCVRVRAHTRVCSLLIVVVDAEVGERNIVGGDAHGAAKFCVACTMIVPLLGAWVLALSRCVFVLLSVVDAGIVGVRCC